VGKARGKLNLYARGLLVERITQQGYPVRLAAEMAGVSAGSAYRWLRRWRAEGEAGLADRSCRPHSSPRRTPAEVEQRVVALRVATKLGPHQLAGLLGMPRSTVYVILRRHGLSRLAVLDRPTGQPVRYQRDHPGELVHVDVTKVARIPDGGGWRVHGRGRGATHRQARAGL
jgi:transposase